MDPYWFEDKFSDDYLFKEIWKGLKKCLKFCEKHVNPNGKNEFLCRLQQINAFEKMINIFNKFCEKLNDNQNYQINFSHIFGVAFKNPFFEECEYHLNQVRIK